eukprot:110803-Pyramimonas_sp.AAC.1
MVGMCHSCAMGHAIVRCLVGVISLSPLACHYLGAKLSLGGACVSVIGSASEFCCRSDISSSCGCSGSGWYYKRSRSVIVTALVGVTSAVVVVGSDGSERGSGGSSRRLRNFMSSIIYARDSSIGSAGSSNGISSLSTRTVRCPRDAS